jgi:hypothetical protein
MKEKTLTSTFVGFDEQCRLRTDLTRGEWLDYILVTLRHDPSRLEGQGPVLRALDDVIPPGPYLEELKAHGLVTCALVRKYSSRLSLFPGTPERFCLGKP